MSRTKPEPVPPQAHQVVVEGPSAAAAPQPPVSQQRTIRHAHLFLTRLDPWSVMKAAFMLSIAIAIVLIVAVLILWGLLSMSGTLSSLSRTVNDIAGAGASEIDIAGLLSFGRVFGLVSLVAAMEVVLVSALATLFAYLYNLSVAITGGLQVTLTEDQ
jgi:hypothetical protein